MRRNGEMCCSSQQFQICSGESQRDGSNDKAGQQPYGPRGAAPLTAIPSSPCWKPMRSLPCPECCTGSCETTTLYSSSSSSTLLCLLSSSCLHGYFHQCRIGWCPTTVGTCYSRLLFPRRHLRTALSHKARMEPAPHFCF